MLQFYLQLVERISDLEMRNDKLCALSFPTFGLTCLHSQSNQAIFTGRKPFYVHPVTGHSQRGIAYIVFRRLNTHNFVIGIEYIQRDCPYLVIKQVAMHVIIVTETHIEAFFTVAAVFIHHCTRREQKRSQQAYQQTDRRIVNHSFHKQLSGKGFSLHEKERNTESQGHKGGCVANVLCDFVSLRSMTSFHSPFARGIF